MVECGYWRSHPLVVPLVPEISALPMHLTALLSILIRLKSWRDFRTRTTDPQTNFILSLMFLDHISCIVAAFWGMHS
jgi:hypothetical protein